MLAGCKPYVTPKILAAVSFVAYQLTLDNPDMAKLTRYSSFEEMKAAPLDNPLTPAESAKAHAEFEVLMRRLQQEFAAQKKRKSSNER